MKSIRYFSALYIFLQIYFYQGKMTSYWVIIVIITLCYADCKETCTCQQKIAVSYLDTAVDMIAKANTTISAGSITSSTCEGKMALSYLDTAVDMIAKANTTVSADSTASSTCEKKIVVSYLDTAVDMIAKANTTIPEGSNTTSTCEEKMAESYLDTAVDMIAKAKASIPGSISCDNNFTRRALDCSEVLEMGYTTSGVYKIWPANIKTEDKSLKVYCDMQTNGGGWTLIQRRGNFQRPIDYFYKDWKSYKEGFGDLEKDFWLGNDNIFALTNQKVYSLRFDLKDVENNTRYAEYSMFRIDDENHHYTLHFTGYSGDAGDSLSNTHNNQKFSTKDRDNDNWKESCAQKYKGAWWYSNCVHSNLNGLYHRGKHDSYADGVNWESWKGFGESLESTEMKIRPESID